MSIAELVIPVLILIGGLAVTSTSSFARPEYTKKEKKACAFCQVTATSGELNESGKLLQGTQQFSRRLSAEKD